MRAFANCCPTCGQRLLVRHGVKLSPHQADLFDMIARARKHGVSSEVLAGVFYPGKSLNDGKRCVAVNVSHLNAKLAETDVIVRASRGSPYRVFNLQDTKSTLEQAAS